MEDDRIFSIYATIARISHHCFKLCDQNSHSSSLSSNSKLCIQSCVQNAMTTRQYVNDRLAKEYPESKKYNKSLEFTSSIEFT